MKWVGARKLEVVIDSLGLMLFLAAVLRVFGINLCYFEPSISHLCTGGNIAVCVAKPDGTVVMVNTRKNGTVDEFLHICKKKVPYIKSRDFYLTFGGKVLNKDRLISEYCLQTHSTVFMSFRLLGGGKSVKDRREYFRQRRMRLSCAKTRAQERARKKRLAKRKKSKGQKTEQVVCESDGAEIDLHSKTRQKTSSTAKEAVKLSQNKIPTKGTEKTLGEEERIEGAEDGTGC